MELFFLALLIVLMVWALGSGFPVAFALPGSAILSIGAAALAGWLFAGDSGAYFAQGGPVQWLTAGVTNFRGIYWEAERDTLQGKLETANREIAKRIEKVFAAATGDKGPELVALRQELESKDKQISSLEASGQSSSAELSKLKQQLSAAD